MRRRAFITLLGGALVGWPLAVRAQQPKMATVGILVAGNSPEAFLQGFRAALAATGLIEGLNVQLEVCSAEGSDTLLPKKATDIKQTSQQGRV